MKFGIVGPISKDRVVWPNGETVCKYGAVAYSAAVLAKLLEGTEDYIICLSHISPDDAGEVTKLLDYTSIEFAGINAQNQTGAAIDLRYLDQHERASNQTRVMTPFSLQEILGLTDCDYIVLMPLNETDIPIDLLDQLRRRSSAVIFLDVHGLITGIDEQGRRYKKNWERSEEWLKNIDILKMNDKEASWAAGRFLQGFADYLQYALDMLKKGLVACWITFGNQSSLLAWRRSNKIFWAAVPVTDAGKIVDTIGCGDAASAGFIYGYARLHSPLIAVIMGNMLGSVKASICDTTDFPTQTEVRSMLYEHYRQYFHSLLDEFLSQQHLIVNEVKEDLVHESFMYGPNGDRYDNGSNHARGSHSQGATAPWS